MEVVSCLCFGHSVPLLTPSISPVGGYRTSFGLEHFLYFENISEIRVIGVLVLVGVEFARGQSCGLGAHELFG
jgi:hypothetical protein